MLKTKLIGVLFIYVLYFRSNILQNPLLRSTASTKPDSAVLALGEKVDGLRLDPRAGGWTEAVEALTIDMNPSTVHLRGAPGRPGWLAAVDPVSTRVIGHLKLYKVIVKFYII